MVPAPPLLQMAVNDSARLAAQASALAARAPSRREVAAIRFAVPSAMAALAAVSTGASSPGVAVLAACGAGVPVLAGLLWSARRPGSGLGLLLILSGFVGLVIALRPYAPPATVVAEGALVLLAAMLMASLAYADQRAGRLLRRLVYALAERPSMAGWTATIGRELGDPALRLLLWDEGSRRFREVSRAGDKAPAPQHDRRWVPVGDGPAPVAVLSVRRHLTDFPELLQAVCAATALAIRNDQLEGELRTSIARVAAAGDAERRRIARDLHDSAQQRLLSLRVLVNLAGDALDRPEERAAVATLGREVDQVLAELRDLTHGLYPVVLSRYGLAAALRSACNRAALPVRVEDDGIKRHDETVEHAVYFCCLEALQNAAKHGGKDASAVVRLTETEGALSFEVADDGLGFAPQWVRAGAGLLNLADRLRAVGGTLKVESAPGHGARILGRITLA